jgi:hypothetical protein
MDWTIRKSGVPNGKDAVRHQYPDVSGNKSALDIPRKAAPRSRALFFVQDVTGVNGRRLLFADSKRIVTRIFPEDRMRLPSSLTGNAHEKRRPLQIS